VVRFYGGNSKVPLIVRVRAEETLSVVVVLGR
jgi:hypothetical protein